MPIVAQQRYRLLTSGATGTSLLSEDTCNDRETGMEEGGRRKEEGGRRKEPEEAKLGGA
jgi:hypothetical protein